MGAEIPAAESLESPEAKSLVTWHKEADKTGFIYSGKNSFKSGEGEFTTLGQGDNFAGSHAYLLLADVPGGSANSGATIAARNSGDKEAFLATETTASAENVLVGAGSELKTLLDNSGNSDFLQLVSAAQRKINFGVTEVEWPGGEFVSKGKEITHGLGAQPKAVIATAADSGRCAGVSIVSSTIFILNLQTLQGDFPAKGTKSVVYWLAIG